MSGLPELQSSAGNGTNAPGSTAAEHSSTTKTQDSVPASITNQRQPTSSDASDGTKPENEAASGEPIEPNQGGPEATAEVDVVDQHEWQTAKPRRKKDKRQLALEARANEPNNEAKEPAQPYRGILPEDAGGLNQILATRPEAKALWNTNASPAEEAELKPELLTNGHLRVCQERRKRVENHLKNMGLQAILSTPDTRMNVWELVVCSDENYASQGVMKPLFDRLENMAALEACESNEERDAWILERFDAYETHHDSAWGGSFLALKAAMVDQFFVHETRLVTNQSRTEATFALLEELRKAWENSRKQLIKEVHNFMNNINETHVHACENARKDLNAKFEQKAIEEWVATYFKKGMANDVKRLILMELKGAVLEQMTRDVIAEMSKTGVLDKVKSGIAGGAKAEPARAAQDDAVIANLNAKVAALEQNQVALLAQVNASAAQVNALIAANKEKDHSIDRLFNALNTQGASMNDLSVNAEQTAARLAAIERTTTVAPPPQHMPPAGWTGPTGGIPPAGFGSGGFTFGR